MINAYAQLLQRFANEPLLIAEEKLRALVRFLELKAGGMTFIQEELADRFHAQEARHEESGQGGVAVIPIVGHIEQRDSFFLRFFGGVSAQKISRDIQQAVQDPNVAAIVLDIDSPGGTVAGIPQLGELIFNARKVKPIVAVSNSSMNSAAYWIGSAASEIVAAPASYTGSIGVWILHEDYTEMAENAGVKWTLFKAGENKIEGNPYEPLSDSAAKRLQEIVDKSLVKFEKAVARHRGITVAKVRSDYGRGRSFQEDEALQLGLVDRIDTLENTIARLMNPRQRKALTAQAAASGPVTLEKPGPEESNNTPLEKGSGDSPGDLSTDPELEKLELELLEL